MVGELGNRYWVAYAYLAANLNLTLEFFIAGPLNEIRFSERLLSYSKKRYGRQCRCALSTCAQVERIAVRYEDHGTDQQQSLQGTDQVSHLCPRRKWAFATPLQRNAPDW